MPASLVISLAFAVCALCVAGQSFPGQYQVCVPETSIHPGVSVSIARDSTNQMAQITISGPASSWFGQGFGQSGMAGSYVLTVDGTAGTLVERDFTAGQPGTVLPSSSVSAGAVTAQTVNGVRTAVLERPYAASSHSSLPSSDFSDFLNCRQTTLSAIAAIGTSLNFGNVAHGRSNRSPNGVLTNICCTDRPTYEPTPQPTPQPVAGATQRPTGAPTTGRPTQVTQRPTGAPTTVTRQPTLAPTTGTPTQTLTQRPSKFPTAPPTQQPVAAGTPTRAPVVSTARPTAAPVPSYEVCVATTRILPEVSVSMARDTTNEMAKITISGPGDGPWFAQGLGSDTMPGSYALVVSAPDGINAYGVFEERLLTGYDAGSLLSSSAVGNSGVVSQEYINGVRTVVLERPYTLASGAPDLAPSDLRDFLTCRQSVLPAVAAFGTAQDLAYHGSNRAVGELINVCCAEAPTAPPTAPPTGVQTVRPTASPIVPGSPTRAPVIATARPTASPIVPGSPTRFPTAPPTRQPVAPGSPTAAPVASPTAEPTDDDDDIISTTMISSVASPTAEPTDSDDNSMTSTTSSTMGPGDGNQASQRLMGIEGIVLCIFVTIFVFSF